jgi:DNA-binding beta-propeller fold protein YncE
VARLNRPLATAFAVASLCAAARAADPLELEQTVPLEGKAGNLDHLAVDVKGGRVFVANKPNGTLDVVDLKTGKLVKQIADQGKVSGVAYSADLDRVFVGNGSGTCNAFDGKDYKLVFSAKAPKADNVNYHAAARLVYVCHGDTISALSADSGEVKATITLPGDGHGFAIDEKANKIYVSLTKPSQVGVIDLVKSEVVETFPLTLASGNSPIAHDAATGRLFVGCRKEPMVVVLDAKTGKELAGVAIPGDIDDLLFDAKSGRAFAICGAGAVVVIAKTGDKYEVTAKVETAKSARTATLSSAGDRLYLGVPVQGGKGVAEVRVFAVKP